ncbi:hypothetical protein ACSDQ9_00605 [Aestuariimicrobium soli]|uniref:hypothetical protein n=1 Tax=Aestuariimicrobium soli TaxID=2035834 RepID=UPI003EBE56C0
MWSSTAHGTVEHCDDRLQSAMRAATTAVLTERGLDRATALPEELLDARVRATQLTRNVPGGWWCCQDDPAAADEALMGSLRLDEVVRIAACSDGATRGHQLLDAWTLAEFADLLASPQGVLTATRTAEDEQAEWLVRSLQKPHDDLTVVTLTP